MPSPSKQIADLEAEMDRLGRSAERCVEIMRAAKAAIALGAVTFLCALSGLFPLPGGSVLGAVTIVIGGLVVLGTNAGTRTELLQTIENCERERDALINELPLSSIASH